MTVLAAANSNSFRSSNNPQWRFLPYTEEAWRFLNPGRPKLSIVRPRCSFRWASTHSSWLKCFVHRGSLPSGTMISDPLAGFIMSLFSFLRGFRSSIWDGFFFFYCRVFSCSLYVLSVAIFIINVFDLISLSGLLLYISFSPLRTAFRLGCLSCPPVFNDRPVFRPFCLRTPLDQLWLGPGCSIDDPVGISGYLGLPYILWKSWETFNRFQVELNAVVPTVYRSLSQIKHVSALSIRDPPLPTLRSILCPHHLATRRGKIPGTTIQRARLSMVAFPSRFLVREPRLDRQSREHFGARKATQLLKKTTNMAVPMISPARSLQLRLLGNHRLFGRFDELPIIQTPLYTVLPCLLLRQGSI